MRFCASNTKVRKKETFLNVKPRVYLTCVLFYATSLHTTTLTQEISIIFYFSLRHYFPSILIILVSSAIYFRYKIRKINLYANFIQVQPNFIQFSGHFYHFLNFSFVSSFVILDTRATEIRSCFAKFIEN